MAQLGEAWLRGARRGSVDCTSDSFSSIPGLIPTQHPLHRPKQEIINPVRKKPRQMNSSMMNIVGLKIMSYSYLCKLVFHQFLNDIIIVLILNIILCKNTVDKFINQQETLLS
jgi:hypothetical protein